MKIRLSPVAMSGLLLPAFLVACASSDVDRFAVADPDSIVTDIAVRPSDSAPGLYTFSGPSIDVRAGYGAFAKGMLRGGSGLGSAISLHGTQTAPERVEHRIVATLQYTNLGGAYRMYDRAGIEGVDALTVETVDRHKQFTPNGVIMTEMIAVGIGDAVLRSLQDADIILRVGTDSGNLQTLQIPRNYIIAYLRAVDRQIRAEIS